MRWDGTAWNVVPSANVGDGDNRLANVVALADDDVWAIGSSVSSIGAPQKPLILHWNGQEWGVVTPSIGGADKVGISDELTGVAEVGGVLWLAGQREDATGTHTLLEADGRNCLPPAPTATPTAPPSSTPTSTPTSTSTPIATQTPTRTATSTASTTPVAVPTYTPVNTPASINTSTASSSVTGGLAISGRGGEGDDRGVIALVGFTIGMLASALVLLAVFLALLLTGRITTRGRYRQDQERTKEPSNWMG